MPNPAGHADSAKYTSHVNSLIVNANTYISYQFNGLKQECTVVLDNYQLLAFSNVCIIHKCSTTFVNYFEIHGRKALFSTYV